MTVIIELRPLVFCAAKPSGVGISCQFNINAYRDSLFEDFTIALPSTLREASLRRKAEFLAGRYLAKIAMQNLAIPASDIAIGAQRNPLWPSAVVGSISHSKNHAVCFMQATRGVQLTDVGVGLDLETIIDEPSARQILPSIISPEERKMLCNQFTNDTQEDHFGFAFSLIFSAKESLFKALYPNVGRYFDFLDVRLSALDTEAKQLTLQLLRDLSPSLRAGREILVRWQSHPIGLLTYILP